VSLLPVFSNQQPQLTLLLYQFPDHYLFKHDVFYSEEFNTFATELRAAIPGEDERDFEYRRVEHALPLMTDVVSSER
jgi:hypothetical protein